MKMTRSVLTVVMMIAVIGLGASFAQAAAIPVTNHSFENPVYASPGDSGLTHPGWTDLGGNAGTGRTTVTQYPGGLPDGVNYAWTNQAADALGQTLGATLQPSTTYTLTVATGWRADLAAYPNYPGYGIELWAGGTLLAFDYDTSNGGSGTGPAAGTWKDVTATYTSPASVTADPLQIRLLAGNAVNSGTAIQTNYDNVRLDAAPSGTTVPIPGLFNTGVDAAGNPLPNSAASSDLHYSIIVNPDGGGAVPNVEDETAFPIAGPWLNNTAISKWIAPRFNTSGAFGAPNATGDYTYRTTFDLTGLDPSTASISGLWATDNAGLDILLNGQSTGNANPTQFSSFTPFTIGVGSPFVAGVNTLDFQLNNSAVGYTALHVQFTSATAEEASGGAIPEPMTMLAVGMSISGLGGYIKRRRRG